MDIYKKHIYPVQMSLLISVIFTAMLFMGLPLLTKIHLNPDKPEENPYILISPTKPPPPPEANRDKEALQKPKEMDIKETTPERVTPVPEIERFSFAPGVDTAGTIKIIMPPKESLYVETTIGPYEPSQVDQKPRVLRSSQPLYPFQAKHNNIEGMVVLKFVVDKGGNVVEPKVHSADPEGVFEESALKAIAKYKFQPAVKDGEPVDCIAILEIRFALR